MLQIFRDDSLPPDVLCLLASDGTDIAVITNARHVNADPARMREAINAVLAEADHQPKRPVTVSA